MPVYFASEGAKGVAYFRASDEAEDVFVAAVSRDSYDSDPLVKEHFAELVRVVADHCRRTHAAGTIDPGAWIGELPCSKCASPQAADVLHRARQAANLFELGLSPGGNYPAGCCKTRIVGVMGRGPDTSRPAARR
jgi:hypothetical protein